MEFANDNVDSDGEDIPELVDLPSENSRKIPVTILTGFLGSGSVFLLHVHCLC